MDAALAARALAAPPAPPPGVNKWEALRELAIARQDYGLSDRDLVVLQALVSFFPSVLLEGEDLVVHPSNEAICERLNGMPMSTMRRHLARLVQSGVIARRDSPNGKRYARKSRAGRVVFGLDLAPLARQHAQVCAAAEALRAARDALRRQREGVSLMRRDLAGLAAWGAEIRPDLPLWDDLATLAAQTARALRRQLTAPDLTQIEARLLAALDAARTLLEPSETDESSTNPAEFEQHHQNSDSEFHVLESREENPEPEPDETPPPPRIPIALVLRACPEIATYADGPIRHWHHLVRAADVVRPMMGISPSAWDEARRLIGPEDSAIVLAAMLERFSSIRSPGGYLRRLSQQAAGGGFSPGPMVMALMRKDAA